QPEQVLPAFAALDRPMERRDNAIRLLRVEHPILQVFGNVVFTQAGEVVEALIIPDDAAVRVRHPDELRDRFGKGTKAFLTLTNAALAFEQRPGIAGNLAGADDGTAAVAHRRDGDRNVDQVSGLVDALGEELADTLAKTDPLENAVLFILP